ncbi:hypothetical protein K438DRAFT_644752 [Mycena galopus ATCC 62051]|nr:hypothetical protein K438DRAFT_644752 [Mycena galopus ATCC 62051]
MLQWFAAKGTQMTCATKSVAVAGGRGRGRGRCGECAYGSTIFVDKEGQGESGCCDNDVADAPCIHEAAHADHVDALGRSRTSARGTFCCKYGGIQMIKQGHGGRIIGASSIAGKQG